MKCILGKKLGMSQVFDSQGDVIPVTLVEAGPCCVVQIKNNDKDGYQAVQLGFDKKKEKNIAKAQKGHLQKANLKEVRYFKEFKMADLKDCKVGDKITVADFEEGDKVLVVGTTKGRGFQGVVKRHGFKGMPATHGTKHQERAPGSIGCGFPERVWKGRKMAGRMGMDRKTVKGVKVVKIDADNNILAISGALPGRKGSLLMISSK